MKIGEVFIFLLFSLIFLPNFFTAHAASTWYVSKSGNNSSGQSWATAWNELDRIDWIVVQPGDTILIDGGATSMTYISTLSLNKSGASSSPIKIQLATEAGRNGKISIFGGRSTPLPYCGQTSYDYQTSGVRQNGIYVTSGVAYVVVDGMKWRGITVYGHNQYGINLRSGSDHITIRNVEVYDNGKACPPGTTNCAGKGNYADSWTPDLPGVNLTGNFVTFERAIIRDNGQDAFQSGGGVYNFTLKESWLYNSRASPNGGYFWNSCTHSDGIQIFNGGTQGPLSIERAVIGPNLMQGLILGQTGAATINDVTIYDTLLYNTTNANIMGYDGTAPVNWTLDRVTSVRQPGANWHNVLYPGTSLQITNSIFYGGTSMTIANAGTYSNNCQYQVGGVVVGQNLDPGFVDIAGGNFALPSGSPCEGIGSSLTSASQLLGISDPVSPTPASGELSFQAESGIITAPFSINGTYISQTVETTIPSSGGKASYTFNISQGGSYVISMRVNAPSLASDSLFLNIDAEPIDPTMIWDISPLTNSFEDRTVSWRGTGTFDVNQFNPKVFNLTAGSHTLIIRGREANVQIDSISVTPNPCTLLGDLNCDGKIDGGDLILILGKYGELGGGTGGEDQNGDGKVDAVDAVILLKNWQP
ncbi:hypothetical protein A3D77_00995 [Candidatus Gottesmanbacteria bacterium RIFCSPHIGHO2_02_FULL_39_11]|uniref:Probable pectate lyase C n=1 Tax=Candidatus Gottesmanbacteria bacterium RIFCSPHIGHO2_02_FULL_39_11 TaxID=1798382 RepID=A0A1F5ZVL9_9BACT|nr:MAG: hypothetical protein A3D77_00995 [Candidatus Gottesmanbacteria bacterium RIFCSPHIGHO2_02_FULL_39_11]